LGSKDCDNREDNKRCKNFPENALWYYVPDFAVRMIV
jgi:hypothetical protein